MIPPPLKSSSVLTPTLATLLLKLPASPTCSSGFSIVCRKPSLDYLFLNILWLLNTLSANSEIPYNDSILPFKSHLLLACQSCLSTPGPHTLSYLCCPLSLWHLNLVIVPYLWHLSLSVLGSAHMTPHHEIFYNPHYFSFPPFLSVYTLSFTSRFSIYSILPCTKLASGSAVSPVRLLSHSLFHLSDISRVTVPAAILDTNNTKTWFSLKKLSLVGDKTGNNTIWWDKCNKEVQRVENRESVW